MPVFEKTINLNIQTTTLFRYFTEYTHFLELCPNIVEISDVRQHTSGSTNFRWIVKLLDVRFEGEAELKQTHHHQQVDVYIWGGIRGDVTMHLHPSDEGTHLTIKVDYSLPMPLLKKHREDVILREFEHSAECALNNMKTQLESQMLSR